MEVGVGEAFLESVQLTGRPNLDAQARGEASRLSVPVVHDTFGTDDEGGARGEGRGGSSGGRLAVGYRWRIEPDRGHSSRNASLVPLTSPPVPLPHPYQPNQPLQPPSPSHVIRKDTTEPVPGEV